MNIQNKVKETKPKRRLKELKKHFNGKIQSLEERIEQIGNELHVSQRNEIEQDLICTIDEMKKSLEENITRIKNLESVVKKVPDTTTEDNKTTANQRHEVNAFNKLKY